MGYIYKTNHDYFSHIDCEEKAYLLGLIYADGTVQLPVKNRQGRVSIFLQEEDGYILSNFRNLVYKDVNIQNPPSVQLNNWKKKANLRVTSNKIVENLIQLGCPPNKSFVGMTFPKLEKYLIHHFIRGFFDGDGCLSLHNKNTYPRLRITFTCTDQIFLNTLFSYLPAQKHYIRNTLRRSIVYALVIERNKDVRNVLQYMYQDSSLFLTRKKDKIDEYNMSIKSQVKRIRLKGLETT